MKIKDYKFGNTKIEVYDDKIHGREEVERILKRVGKIGNKRTLKTGASA